MQGKFAKIVMGLIAMAMALAFYAVPAIKLKDPAMIVVILIGVARDGLQLHRVRARKGRRLSARRAA